MMKKQYRGSFGSPQTYFDKFVSAHPFGTDLRPLLKKYDATLAKSKGPYIHNVKWHNEQKYVLFVMEWS
jgi:hypothetical protein